MILVCGGAGYIGSHMVYRLIEDGKDVCVVDNLSTGFEKAVHKEAKFYKGDIRNDELMDQVFSENPIESVVHFAASSQVGESVQKPLKYYDNNVNASLQLIKSMLRNNVYNIVFSSTAAIFGNVEAMPITEDTPKNPTSPYGETKLAIEKMLDWTSRVTDLNYVALRYFNVAGAHHTSKIGEAHNPETHLIPIVLQVGLGKRDKIFIFGDDYNTKDGTCVRDYIHVEDLADAHVLSLKYLKEEKKSNVFNLGNGEGFSVKEIIDSSRKVTEKEIPAEMADRRPGDPDNLIASSERIKAVLGWEPKYANVEDIIDSAWQWHLNSRY
ncbi:MAG TPA: UDP-glucose 4-epimerase GalE [Clostridia bacterium]|nr:UDP-glucose 4-epimerase GalE [Clostridia bacterium]